MGLSATHMPGLRGQSRRRYSPPTQAVETPLASALEWIGRPPLERAQYSFLTDDKASTDTRIHYAGDLDILKRPAVAIIGTRDVSENGARRADRMAREMVAAGFTVVSGLAKGVDVTAHRACIAAGGQTAAVIGTPLSQAYPAEHADLQELIWQEHLLVSPFAEGERVFQSNFPKRNRVMAALSDGSIIIEASDSSGTLHQAAECQRLGRWLFVLKSVFDDPSLKWPRSFASYKRMVVVSKAEDVVDAVAAG